MERSVAVLRALVVGANVAIYGALQYGSAPRQPLALAICVVAYAYAVWCLVARPYERYPLLRYGIATIVVDALLIALWVLATGGPSSEFWVIYLVSVVSVAMRYDLYKAAIAAAGESALYVGVMLADGGLPASALATRPVYIVITALAAGMLARLEATARAERTEFAQLAARHAELLERERDTVEALRHVDEVKNTFISAISHELRTPLTSIVGFARTLQRRRQILSDDDQARMVERIAHNGEKLERLLLDLLDLNMLNAGVATALREPVAIARLVRRCVAEAGESQRRIVVEADASLTAVVDAGKVERAVDNLLRNALKYSPDGTPIAVRAWNDGDTLLVAVEDRGPGVPDPFKEEIFRQFRKGPAQVSHAPGTGIGLALVAQIAGLHGGRAWVEDRDGGGARFCLSFPRAVTSTGHADALPA